MWSLQFRAGGWGGANLKMACTQNWPHSLVFAHYVLPPPPLNECPTHAEPDDVSETKLADIHKCMDQARYSVHLQYAIQLSRDILLDYKLIT